MENIAELTLEQLAYLRKQIDDLIRIRQTQKIVNARREILSIADEIGGPVHAILDDRAFPGGPIGPRRVRHPERPELEWRGRGRHPNWMKELLAKGKSLDDLQAS
jgi:DNA-binding protein H-NS